MLKVREIQREPLANMHHSRVSCPSGALYDFVLVDLIQICQDKGQEVPKRAFEV